MKRFALLLTIVVLASCSYRQDRLLSPRGATLSGVEVLVSEDVPDGFPSMILREVAFVNVSGKPMEVGAMETSGISVEGSGIWSLQPSSSEERLDWVLPVEKGFHARNYLGMNNSDYGGGIPMVCLWTPEINLSVGIAEPVLKLVSINVERKGNRAQAFIRRDFDEPVLLQPGDTLRSYREFEMTGSGDFFNPLREFARYMHESFGYEPPVSPADAFEAVWCAWGYERNFTVDEVIGTLPKVAELGFKWVDVDDGYQICEGDWEANDRITDEGMKRITAAIHAQGLKAKLWWAPLAADPGSRLASEHPEMLLVRKDGTHEDISWWDSWYLSPVNSFTRDYTLGLVDRFLLDWGFDGFKLDGQHLNLSEPDYNPASGLSYPEEACERLPEFFKAVSDRAEADKSGAVVQVCPCGCAINFFYTPYMNQAVASDPTSSAQIRMKRKVYAAMCPDLAYYADHVELSDGGLDFPTQIGVGGVIGSKFTWPAPNPTVKGDGYLLTPEKEAALRKWVGIYNDKKISTGRYLNLYDYGFDKPEAHVIEKDGAMYYAFYAPEWDGGAIELRGLESREYTVTEYTADEPRSFTVEGPDPLIHPVFKGAYLIEVK
ncbi:MAG: alpha-galactosidase [Bacteroidales bacterium]|nr:alpha-galactosidase [Bacteroidales bacterium]